jgi:hypothetical protein
MGHFNRYWFRVYSLGGWYPILPRRMVRSHCWARLQANRSRVQAVLPRLLKGGRAFQEEQEEQAKRRRSW